MASSQSYIRSSPYEGRRRKSKFTYRHLNLLAQSSPSCPLRVIALIDYDAFYAQCEMVRLGVAADQPLAVQQWQGLIAINYPARAYGLNRHVTITEAKTKCPEIIVQHVATWREGDDKWAYRDDADRHIHTDKVSLDPYRLESRKSLALIKEIMPAAPIQKVEKASIDEVFLDLSAQIHQILLDRYPELRTAPYDDPTEQLPLPPATALNWEADALVDLDAAETEDDDPDWDDVAMNIGSEIVRRVRHTIFDRLGYTCSAGIARNKMMAKLGAGYRKPNQQTIVRNRAVQQFLGEFKFTKIRNLGGKLGDQVVEAFGSDEVTELLRVPAEQMRAKFGPDTGTWLHEIIRGEDTSEVNSRTQIKSMLSAKSFRPSVNSFEQAVKWLRIFVADIYARLVEEGVVENRRRPKTMNLHHRQGGTTRSKSITIPAGKKIDAAGLLDLAKNLLGQIIVDGRAWPCSNLSLSVGGFEEGITGNRGIGSFLLKTDEHGARSLQDTPSRSNTSTPNPPEDVRPEKRRKLENESAVASGIGRFFARAESTEDHQQGTDIDDAHDEDGDGDGDGDGNTPDAAVLPPQPQLPLTTTKHQADITTYLCPKCSTHVAETDRAEHDDWHFAKDLQRQETSSTSASTSTTRPANSNSRPPGGGVQRTVKAKRGGGAGGGSGSNSNNNKPEKGQSRLAFG